MLPVGPPVDLLPPPRPPREVLEGRFVRLEPLDPGRHGEDLFAAYAEDTDDLGWTYMGYGPFPDRASFQAWLASWEGDDPLFYAALVEGRAVGLASFLNLHPEHGRIEVGHVHLAPALQRTRAATEAIHLMREQAFALGYRRYEWKCDALNAASRRAAQRLGFSFEGVFRQHMVVKGRNRDTAWFACLDHQAAALREAVEAWLADENFVDGVQRRPLGHWTAPLLQRRDPSLSRRRPGR